MMNELNNIENATIEQVKAELVRLVEYVENNETFQNGDAFTADIYIKFNDGAHVSLCPTWWAMGCFSGYHYSTTAEHEWLDDDADEGEIADGTLGDWLEASVATLADMENEHGGIAWMLTTCEDL